MVRSLAQKGIVGMLSFAFLFPGCLSVGSSKHYLDITCTDLKDVANEALQHDAFYEGDFPQDRWWELFGDAQLNNFVDLALSCHPDISAANLRVGIAFEKAIEVRSKLLPYVDIMGSYWRQKQTNYNTYVPAAAFAIEKADFWFNTASALIRASYEIDIWGKNRASYYSQLGQVQAKIADLAQARLILSTTIAQAYFSLQSHRIQKDIISNWLQTKQELLKLLQQRYSSGMADEFFPYIVDAQVAELQDLLIQIEGLIELDEHALAALVGNISSVCGRSEGLCAELVASYQQPVPLPSSLPLELISRRPDIMASLWQIQSMSYGVKVAKARFLPNLDLLGMIGPISFFLTKFFTYPALDIWMQATSTLPLYTGGDLVAKLGEAQLELELAVQNYNQTILRAVQDVSDAVTNLKTAQERLQQIERAVKDSGLVYQLTRERYVKGVDAKIPVLNAADTLYSQQNLEQQVWLVRMVAIVSVIRSLGGGYCGA
ncbi:MAG: efflux transporter outer membrane subunit [Verrucomicrobia bacterium]|nr:efflux transporter outer membrane subunit [Verrucomicrobiota bacterium]MBS0646095.1 efflux transporter outer membrane subunit [Verrucomicrobiota bacterium]